jgi:hypothetical protein
MVKTYWGGVNLQCKIKLSFFTSHSYGGGLKAMQVSNIDAAAVTEAEEVIVF